MATVFKRTRTEQIPEGAEVRETAKPVPKNATVRDGVASWIDRAGLQMTAPVADDGRRVVIRQACWTDKRGRQHAAPLDVTGTKVLCLVPTYSAKYRDASGRWVRKATGTRDRETAQRIAAQWEAAAKLRSERVIDPRAERIAEHAKRGIDSHLTDYIAHLATKHGTQDHRDRTEKFIREFIAAGEWQTIADIDADDVNRHAADVKAAGRSARSVQSRLTAVKGFSRWLSKGKLPGDPLASVHRPNPAKDRRRERRMLLPDEWPWLRKATEGGPDREGLTGDERVTLYMLAIQTGLRVGEIASLTRGKVILTTEHPHVICKANNTKNAKLAKQYIDGELNARLRELIGRKTKAAPVFVFEDRYALAEMVRLDLAEARRRWLQDAPNPKECERRGETDFLSPVNHDGEGFDFHALRHTCGAWLALAGEHPKVIQTVMRHASITLTMDTYGHLFPDQTVGAAGKLAAMLGDSGTDAGAGKAGTA